mmetsp:Transcript_74070/g.160224  ORF Transcript_74070/g.160224 Transcript_74070/m.160224 type:complete len:411 (+) Transcript_74070:41-1273(+)
MVAAPRSGGGQLFRPQLPTVFSGIDLLKLDRAEKDKLRSNGFTTTSGVCDSSSDATSLGSVSTGFLTDSITSPETESEWVRQVSQACSAATSTAMYAESGQTLMFLDWDDTLFPTTELFDRWRLTRRTRLTREMDARLEKWRDAVYDYLSMACSLSDRCVIVTNSRRPWVDECIEKFAPDLAPLFKRPNGPRVVYADEAMREARRRKWGNLDGCVAGLAGCLQFLFEELEDQLPMLSEDRVRQLTDAKHVAMRHEATEFYSRYPGQTWKNVISLGDMTYEHDAVLELSRFRTRSRATPRWFRRRRQRVEQLRTKALLLPEEPTLDELTVRLQFLRLLLPAYVRFDGSINLNFRTAKNPLAAMAQALNMPRLLELSIPHHIWGGRSQPHDDSVTEEALDAVSMMVHESFFH